MRKSLLCDPGSEFGLGSRRESKEGAKKRNGMKKQTTKVDYLAVDARRTRNERVEFSA